MNCSRRRYPPKTRAHPLRGEEGAVGVEFALLLPLFLLILAGLVEMGHLWYVQHAITNASREGARAAIVYRIGNDGTRECGGVVVSRATTKVNDYLQGKLPAGSWTVTVTPNPLSNCGPGAPLTVTVRSDKYLLVLDKLVQAFADVNQLEAVTTMRME